MRIIRALMIILGGALLGCGANVEVPATFVSAAAAAEIDLGSKLEVGSGLLPPVLLEADGEPIDIGRLSSIAHAGPWVADVDDDGDGDLLVGDFPGYFWLFDNVGSDAHPQYTSAGRLQAGGVDAKTPVY